MKRFTTSGTSGLRNESDYDKDEPVAVVHRLLAGVPVFPVVDGLVQKGNDNGVLERVGEVGAGVKELHGGCRGNEGVGGAQEFVPHLPGGPVAGNQEECGLLNVECPVVLAQESSLDLNVSVSLVERVV